MNKVYFETMPSSNDYLKKNFQNHENKTVIIVENQTKGRGRLDRTWISSKKDLTFSLLFLEGKYYHSLIAPLVIVYTLLDYKISSYIKWPNDVYVDNLKVSGILIENIFNEKDKICDIIGIGINLTDKNNLVVNFLNRYKVYNKQEFLDSLLAKYELFLDLDNDNLLKLYKENSFILNKKVFYKNSKYLVSDFTINAEIILVNEIESITVNANEIDMKKAIIKK